MPRSINPHLLGGACVLSLLLLPALLGAPWTSADYLLAAALLAMTGTAIELGVWANGNRSYRAGAIVAAATGLSLLWVNGAVGIFATEGDPRNLLFVGVTLFAAIGTAVGRGQAKAMVRTMRWTAIAQAAASVIGWIDGARFPDLAIIGTLVFCALWSVSAALFTRAAGQSAQSRIASSSI